LLDIRQKLAEADADLDAAQAEHAAAKEAFKKAALSRGDTAKASEAVRKAADKVEVAKLLVVFLEQMETQVEEAYTASWRHRRDAFLADKDAEVTARTNANKKNLAGYLVTLAGKVHADGRLLEHLRGLKTRSFQGEVFEQVPAPEPVRGATNGPAVASAGTPTGTSGAAEATQAAGAQAEK
jgi:hypothetical protein